MCIYFHNYGLIIILRGVMKIMPDGSIEFLYTLEKNELVIHEYM